MRHAAERVEVHGHGGLAAAEAVMESLEAVGCTRGQWSDWFEGRGTAREALVRLPEAWGTKAAMILTRQAAGALDRSLVHLERLVDRGVWRSDCWRRPASACGSPRRGASSSPGR